MVQFWHMKWLILKEQLTPPFAGGAVGSALCLHGSADWDWAHMWSLSRNSHREADVNKIQSSVVQQQTEKQTQNIKQV